MICPTWVMTQVNSSLIIPPGGPTPSPRSTDSGDGTFVSARLEALGSTDFFGIRGLGGFEGDNREGFAHAEFHQEYAISIPPDSLVTGLPGEYSLAPQLWLRGQATLTALPSTNNFFTSSENRAAFAEFFVHGGVEVMQGDDVLVSQPFQLVETARADATATLLRAFDAPRTLQAVTFEWDGRSDLLVRIPVVLSVRAKGDSNSAVCHALDDSNGPFRVETLDVCLGHPLLGLEWLFDVLSNLGTRRRWSRA